MSVYVSVRIKVDRDKFEQVVADQNGKFGEVAQRGKAAGAIHHRFTLADDGDVVVVDEWESREQFERFFQSDTDIPQLMAAAGIAGEPQVSFFEPIQVGDEF